MHEFQGDLPREFPRPALLYEKREIVVSDNLPQISIVVPCYFEEEGIRVFHEELSAALQKLVDYRFEILFVDDGSQDRTVEILKEIAGIDDRVQILQLSRNFGHQIALSAGLDRANGDAVIFMDSDLQHPPELIPEMLKLWQDGAEIVSTIREYSAEEGALKKISSQTFYRVINFLSDTEIVAGSADFVLLGCDACTALRNCPERHRFLRGMVSWIGYRRVFLPFQANPRRLGESKYTFRKMIGLALTAVLSFSGASLRITIRLGFFLMVCGLIYLCYILGRFLFIGDLVPGWASVLSVVLLMGGMQLFFLGVLGEYVLRIFEESKRRPLYLLKDGSS